VDAKAFGAPDRRRPTLSLTAALALLFGVFACASSAPSTALSTGAEPRSHADLLASSDGLGTRAEPPTASPSEPAAAPPRWSEERAKRWYDERGWLVGVNYIPSTAINQLEMWQPETFDPTSIDRELGWAESLGFNSLRVFLHDLAWKEDQSGFLSRLEAFLSIAHEHHLGVMLVIFDGVWNPLPQAGPQPAPLPGVHNSGWVQSPGATILGDPARHEELEPYVKSVVGRFKDDPRVDAWDVFNEPDNQNTDSYAKLEVRNKSALAALLIEKTFRWAREAGASQPLTAAPWLTDFSDEASLSSSDKVMLAGSDVISFHNYAKPADMQLRLTNLRRYGRPIICTEYMARPIGSTFNPILGYLKQQGGGAYSWGLVSGKSQTIYPWSSWEHAPDAPPKIWFHDILDAQGKPYDPGEIAYIRSLTNSGPQGVTPIRLKPVSPPG
jgi:Glycosyl hydrolase family 10